MKTKAEIVQRLLEAKQVDAEEAVILLMSDSQVTYIPYNPYPYPYYPINPVWPYAPYVPTWQSTANAIDSTNVLTVN